MKGCPLLVRTACYPLKVGLAHSHNAKRNDRFCHGCEARGEAGVEQWREQWLEPQQQTLFTLLSVRLRQHVTGDKLNFAGKNVSCNIVQH